MSTLHPLRRASRWIGVLAAPLLLGAAAMPASAAAAAAPPAASPMTPLPGPATVIPQPINMLLMKSGCIACHMADRKFVGPAYREIGSKYKDRADAIPYLSQRVRKGGPGNWGKVPMAANDVKRLSDAELKTLLTWILAQKI
jgi:cytochrome c551/c552